LSVELQKKKYTIFSVTTEGGMARWVNQLARQVQIFKSLVMETNVEQNGDEGRINLILRISDHDPFGWNMVPL